MMMCTADIDDIDWARMTSDQFAALISNEEKALQFAASFGLIDSKKQCECGALMTIRQKASKQHGAHFKCTAGKSVCKKTKSILDGSWFSRCKIGIRKCILCVRAYAKESTMKNFAFETGIRSSATIVNWKNHFRSVCFEISCKTRRRIGGSGTTVQVDESLIFKRKNNVGRLTLRQVEHDWVFGGICVETGECFIVSVASSGMQTLAASIVDNVYRETRLVSDSWGGYNSVSSLGF